jgi:type VI secretion system secreted protein VgrG
MTGLLDLTIADTEGVEAHAFRGVEGINRLYHFDVTTSTAWPIEATDEWLGREATLRFERGGVQRTWRGIIGRVQTEGRRIHGGNERHQYEVRLSPRAWLLTRNRTSQIFQDRDVTQVLRDVCESARVPVHFELMRPQPIRAYCTQYAETSWAFVERLCAESGFFWFFRQWDEQHGDDTSEAARSDKGATLVVCDDVRSYQALARVGDEPASLAPSLELAENDGDSTREAHGLRSASRRVAVAATRATFSELDPDRPDLPIVATTTSTTWDTAKPSSATAAPADPKGRAARSGLGLEVYDHEARHLFPQWDQAQDEAIRHLRRARRKADTLRGTSRNPRLAPARTFTIHAVPANHLEGEMALVRIAHRLGGPGGGLYENDFDCVPFATPYVPVRRERPREMCTTALVVGPEGKATHTDDEGRVHVRFSWDRRGERDRTSCWLRVMQPWALPHAGFQFLPRVGTEVVVVFDGGDPDRPMVLGAVHSEVAPMPFGPARHPNVSGLRTQSIGGDGHNELSFDDTPRHERVHLRAQHELDVLALGSRKTRVGADDVLRVHHTRNVEAEHEVSKVHRDRTVEVGGEDRLDVEGGVTTKVVGRWDVGAAQVALHGGRTRLSGGTTEVSGLVTRVSGFFRATLHAAHALVTSATFTHVSSVRRVEILAGQEISLEVGNSRISVRGGSISITSPAIFLNGKGTSVALDDGDLKVTADTKVGLHAATTTLHGSGSLLTLDGSAVVESGAIKLVSGSNAAPSSKTSSVQPTTIRLTDREGQGIPNARYEIVMESGARRDGRLDDRGEAKVYLEGSPQIVFPDHPRAEA